MCLAMGIPHMPTDTKGNSKKLQPKTMLIQIKQLLKQF